MDVSVEKSRSVELLKKSSLSLFVVAAMLLICEAAVRVTTDFPPPLFHADPVLGTTFKPGFDARVYVEESDAMIHLRFNQLGFRGRDWSKEKPSSLKRIALIGDSMVASVATEESQTMAAILEKRLTEQDPSQQWEVMNWGVSGSSTGQELVLYEKLVRQFQPDLVICCFCVWNDLADNDPRLTSSPNRIYFQQDEEGNLKQIPRDLKRSTASNFLNEHSRLYVWQKIATAKFASQAKSQRLSDGKRIFCSEPTNKTADAWALSDRLLEHFANTVQSDGIPFILAVLPSSDQIYEENWQRVKKLAGEASSEMQSDYPEAHLAELGRRSGFRVVSMIDEFRAYAPHRSRAVESEWLHFNANGHFNQAGNATAAETIFQAIGDTPLIASSGTTDASGSHRH